MSVKHFPRNPRLEGQARVLESIPYSQNGQILHLILPWINKEDASAPAAPLLLFVQGNSWTAPDLGFHLPYLCKFAEAGLAVATVSYRSILDGNPFPAFLEDIKCAIRFLRDHAGEYSINTEHIVAFGTSAGGHAVELLGLTGDDARYKTEEYAEFSDAVDAVVSCYGASDLCKVFLEEMAENPMAQQAIPLMFGFEENKIHENMQRYSPLLQVEANKNYPPFLLAHGTGDCLVPCSHSQALYDKLLSLGYSAELALVDEADHEFDFWSKEVSDYIFDWILEKYKAWEK